MSGARVWPWYVLALAVVVLDHLTKWMATHMLDYAQPMVLLPVLDLTLLHNRGAAFSFLSDAGGWQRWFFAAIALGVSGFMKAAFGLRLAAAFLAGFFAATFFFVAIGRLLN